MKAMLQAGALLLAVAGASLEQGRGLTRFPSPDEELRAAFGNQKGAAVLVRVQDAQVLAAYNVPVLTRRLATPGSSIKPFTLHFVFTGAPAASFTSTS